MPKKRSSASFFSGRVNNVVFRPLVASVADAFVAQAKTRVPVRTGKLRDAIKVDTSRAEATDTLTRAVVHVASDQKKKGEPFYWRFFEYGTSKMKARPYIRPTLDVDGPRLVDQMEKVGVAGIEREACR